MFEFTLTKTAFPEKTEYGILISEDGETVRAYPAVSARQDEAERLRQRLSRGDISPLHFDDVVRDFLLELAYDRIADNRLESSFFV